MKYFYTLSFLLFTFFGYSCTSNASIDASSSISKSEIIQEGAVMIDTCEWLKTNAKWYYTPWREISLEEVVSIEVVDEIMIGDQMCSVLGVFENKELIEGSKLTVFYNSETERVHFYENEMWKLLYDFSSDWVIGDIIVCHIPQNYEYYDISSAQGYLDTSDSFFTLKKLDEEWTTVNDEEVKIIHTQSVTEEDSECIDMRFIISGVGSKTGFLGRSCTQLTSGFGEYFRCHVRDGFSYSEVEQCVPPQKVWFGDVGAKWHHCLLEELGDPYTVDINTEVIESTTSEIMHTSTIQGNFFGHTYNSEIDQVDIMNFGSKVYYSFGDSMHLLYDFDVEPGDTLTLRFPVELEPNWFEDNPTTSKYFKIVVNGITGVFIDSEFLQRVHFTTIIETDDDFNHIWAPTYLGDYYTEKLGYERFILPFIVTGYDENNVTCSLKEFENLELYYENEDAYCLTLSTKDLKSISNLNIYPNPATNSFKIDFAESDTFFGEIINTCGQKVKIFETKEVDVSGLDAGFYVVQLRSENNTYIGKLLVGD